MRGPRDAHQSVRARIIHTAADVSYAQRRFAELNRPWVTRHVTAESRQLVCIRQSPQIPQRIAISPSGVESNVLRSGDIGSTTPGAARMTAHVPRPGQAIHIQVNPSIEFERYTMNESRNRTGRIFERLVAIWQDTRYASQRLSAINRPWIAQRTN
jgi:hypothetical protein